MSSAISIQPLGPDDYYAIAALEAHGFDDDPITVYAYGPNRATPAALRLRADSLAGPSPAAYPLVRMRKAVTPSGEIVGYASWKFYTNVERNPVPIGQDALEGLKKEEEEEEEDRGDDGEGDGKRSGERGKQSGWPEGANVRLCEAVFGMSDECCRVSMRGKRYAVLNILVVSPEYQGRGVGSKLIREGLDVVDEMGLPTWLGATEVALPLYTKVGFQVDRRFEFDMGPYGGVGLTKHILMIRPVVERREI